MGTAVTSVPQSRQETTALRQRRVWLVAGMREDREPADHPVVRDDLMREWESGSDGRYHTLDGRHHATWAELHARHDLVEVLGSIPATETTDSAVGGCAGCPVGLGGGV